MSLPKHKKNLLEIEIGLNIGYDLKPGFLSGLKESLPDLVNYMSASSQDALN